MSDEQAKTETIKVLCVDDSTSIIALLKAILAPKHGFTVVGSAENGKVAARLVQELKPDLMTLDIHMPELDGVSYMEHHFKKESHPPVVMISSVAREEAELAQRALRAGASDYVEKPEFSNLNMHAEEIRSKLHMAYKLGKLNKPVSDFDAGNGRSSNVKSSKIARVFVVGEMDYRRLPLIFTQIQGTQPPTVILADVKPESMANVVKYAQTGSYKNLGVVSDVAAIQENEAGIMLFNSGLVAVQSAFQARKIAVCLIGYPSPEVAALIANWSGILLILEDLDANADKAYAGLKRLAKDAMPIHSMGYMSLKLIA